MKFSVLTPCFNSAAYIRRSIESLLRQDYPSWEHIVMDGGSEDGTLEILREYPHIQWESQPDLGQSDAMNKAFIRATGDVVIYLNADDELHSGLLSHLVILFNRFPSIEMLVGNLTVKSSDGIRIRKPVTSLISILDYRNYSFPLNPVSYAYKPSLQRKIGLFPIDNHYTMDYWFLLRAYLYGHVLKHDFNCGTFYFDGNNKSSHKLESVQSLRLARNQFLWQYWYTIPVAKFLLRKVLSRILRVVK